jgi:AcrR family transcriptional regulator
MARPRTGIAPRIVRAARALFLRDGVDGASLREIARGARTSIGMVYYYFPSKDDLLLAVVEEVYQGLLADAAEALSKGRSAEERIRALYGRLACLSDDEVDIVRLVVRESLVSSDRRLRILERFQRGHLPLLLRTIAGGVEEGELDSGVPPVVMTLAAMTLGLAPQVIGRIIGDVGPYALIPKGTDLSTALGDVLFDGIRKRPRGGEGGGS